jgi:hypothetical protein
MEAVGSVIGDVVERDSDFSDIEEPTLQHPTGFPVSEIRYPIRNAKPVPKHIDPALFEQEKMEWTELPQEETSSSIRFDFAGNRVIGDELKDSSLYHHGDQPTKPGYTLQELVHLTKSTVPSQRVISFEVLSKIMKKISQGEYQQSNQFYQELLELDVFVVARVGLDATHETVLFAALGFIATSLGFGMEFDIWERIIALKYGLRTIAMEHLSLKAFERKAQGQHVQETEDEIGNTINAVSEKMNEDVVLGLLMSNIVPRLNYILQTYKLEPATMILVIHVLIVIAKHSASSAEDILASDGLVDCIKKYVENVQWPSRSEIELLVLKYTIQLFTFIAQSSRTSADALVQFGVLQPMIRFVTCVPSLQDPLYAPKRMVTASVFAFLTIMYAYGLEGWVLDSYRQVFWEHFQFAVSHLNSEVDAMTLALQCKSIRMALASFESQMDAGGMNDVFQSQIELLLPLIHQDVLLIDIDFGIIIGRDLGLLPHVFGAIPETCAGIRESIFSFPGLQRISLGFENQLCTGSLPILPCETCSTSIP